LTENDDIAIASKENKDTEYVPTLSITYEYEDINAQNLPVVLPRSTDKKVIKDIMENNGYVDT
jgi:hypothetical protein